MNSLYRIASYLALICPLPAFAQLTVSASPPRITGQKVVVSLAMKNNFSERIDSARAVVFLTGHDGKMIGQSTKWVIGGTPDKPGLAAGATNVFNFVLTLEKPLATTNLTTKVSFNRVVLEGGKLADVNRDVKIQN